MKNKKNYLSFDDMRVSYAPKDDTIQITSGDPDLASGGWRLALQRHSAAERTLRAKLEAAGLVRLPVTAFPEFVSDPEVDEHPWHVFPLGVNNRGEEVCMDLQKAPHALLVGSTGTGKSIAIESLLAHVAHNLSRWQVTAIDLQRVEMARYKGIPVFSESYTHVHHIDEAVAAVEKLQEFMWQRYSEMEEHDFRYLELIDQGRAKAQMLLVNEGYLIFSPASGDDEANRVWNEKVSKITDAISSIARLGRAAGIFIILATQRMDEGIYPAELRNNLENRILLGRPNSARIARLVLDYEPELNEYPKGRGSVNLTGNREGIQSYYPTPHIIAQIVLGK